MSTSIQEAPVCPICYDEFTDPRSTLCGHTYCFTCLQTHIDTWERTGSYSRSAGPYPKCPICQRYIQEMPLPNILLAEFLEAGKAGREVTPAEVLEVGEAASEVTPAGFGWVQEVGMASIFVTPEQKQELQDHEDWIIAYGLQAKADMEEQTETNRFEVTKILYTDENDKVEARRKEKEEEESKSKAYLDAFFSKKKKKSKKRKRDDASLEIPVAPLD